MKNKLLLILSLGLILASCKSNKAEDPLILPPNFNDMPVITDNSESLKSENNQTDNTKKKDQDIQNLKELLLKKQ